MQINLNQTSQDLSLASHRCDEQVHPLPGEASSAEELSTGIHGADEELAVESGEYSAAFRLLIQFILCSC